MKVAHIGPPLARQGGPAGYLYQLQRAAAEAGVNGRVTFPPPAARVPATKTPIAQRVRAQLGVMKRAILGAPPPRRPSDAALGAERGHVEQVMREACRSIVQDAAASLAWARVGSPDVLFCHDAPTAAHLLEVRKTGQQVWLMVHNPMPLALYLVWNWGVPERDWRDVAIYPDVRRWTTWELDTWRAVDRLVLPCRDALDEVGRIDPAALQVETPTSFVLSGASADETSRTVDRAALRRQWKLPLDAPVGLYLGNHQAYRGLDALMAAVPLVDSAVPGIVAVAGPPRHHVARHPRVRALGHVSAVADLMSAVDFVINVNRFSLFDLSTIEALEAGKPLLMHDVGGNRTFKALGAGAEMVRDLEPATIAAGLSRLFAASADRLDALSAESRGCYLAHLTRTHLWSRHAAILPAAPALTVTR
jgi:glycosyltransferase involved in cell wall biosynthesis